jgi:hypothetical protein
LLFKQRKPNNRWTVSFLPAQQKHNFESGRPRQLGYRTTGTRSYSSKTIKTQEKWMHCSIHRPRQLRYRTAGSCSHSLNSEKRKNDALATTGILNCWDWESLFE